MTDPTPLDDRPIRAGREAPADWGNVMLYSSTRCSYCVAAKRLLDGRGVPYSEVVVDLTPEGRLRVLEDTGQMTVPQIVVDGRLVGGYDELARVMAAG